MNQVYICADFGSDGAENIRKATRYAGFVYGHDMIPIAPAMYSGALNLSKPKDLLWVFGDRTTPEMREEIRSFQAINGANARVRYVSDAELERYYNRRPCGRKFRRK